LVLQAAASVIRQIEVRFTIVRPLFTSGCRLFELVWPHARVGWLGGGPTSLP